MLMQQKEEWRFIRLQKDFAISVTFNPNESTVLTDLTQDARVDINTKTHDSRITCPPRTHYATKQGQKVRTWAGTYKIKKTFINTNPEIRSRHLFPDFLSGLI